MWVTRVIPPVVLWKYSKMCDMYNYVGYRSNDTDKMIILGIHIIVW